jgi:hypothetical protein
MQNCCIFRATLSRNWQLPPVPLDSKSQSVLLFHTISQARDEQGLNLAVDLFDLSRFPAAQTSSSKVHCLPLEHAR